MNRLRSRRSCPGLSSSLALAIVLGAIPLGEVLEAEPQAETTGTWSQFRGPDGQGLSSEKGLPTKWSTDSANVRWQTPIPGEGVSSPIVSKGRVFVTTSYRGSEHGLADGVLQVSTLGLALLILAGVVFRLIRGVKGDPASTVPSTMSVIFAWADRLVVGVALVIFLVLAVAVALGPSYIDFFLAKVRFAMPPEREGGLITWQIGNAATIWLVSGLIAFLGMAVSLGWSRVGSAVRPLGAIVILLLAVPWIRFTPLVENDQQVSLVKRAIFAFPCLGLAAWYVFLDYLKARLCKREEACRPRKLGAWVLPLATVFLAALTFAVPNFLQAKSVLKRVIVCLDLKSGRELWQTSVLSAPAEKKFHANTYATPTPCTDGTRVVANFGTGIGCVDFEGKLLWIKEDADYSKATRYGAAVSTVMTDDAVIVIQPNERNQLPRPTWMAAFDKMTGLELWRKDLDYGKQSYGTPLLVRRGETTELWASSWENVTGYDVKSGERLWTGPTTLQQQVSSLARSGDVFCIGGGTAGPEAIFAMRANGIGKETKVEELWKTDEGAPGVSSPVIHDGRLYVVTDMGTLTCFDLLTGQVHFRERLPKGKYFASLLVADGKLYAANHYGVTTVLAAGPNFQILAQNALGEQCYATPAVAEGCLLIRTNARLYCIGAESKGG